METFEDYLDNAMVPAGSNPPAFSIDSLDKANWAIGKIARAEAKIEQRRLAAVAYKAKLDAWMDDANKADIATVGNLSEMLKPWANVEIAKGKAKSIKLLGGTVGFRSSPAHLEITDEAAALAALPDDCKRVKVEVNKTAVKKRIEETGEIPAGCDLVAGDVRWYIQCDDTPKLT